MLENLEYVSYKHCECTNNVDVVDEEDQDGFVSLPQSSLVLFVTMSIIMLYYAVHAHPGPNRLPSRLIPLPCEHQT